MTTGWRPRRAPMPLLKYCRFGSHWQPATEFREVRHTKDQLDVYCHGCRKAYAWAIRWVHAHPKAEVRT